MVAAGFIQLGATTAKSLLEPRFWALYNLLQLWPSCGPVPRAPSPGCQLYLPGYSCRIIANTLLLGLVQLATVVWPRIPDFFEFISLMVLIIRCFGYLSILVKGSQDRNQTRSFSEMEWV